MNKNELRKLYKLVRSSISNKDEQNTSIYNQIICDKEVINASTILIYVKVSLSKSNVKINVKLPFASFEVVLIIFL